MMDIPTSKMRYHGRTIESCSKSREKTFVVIYEIEAVNNKWSAQELRRQMGSLLYERLAKSKDKVLCLSQGKNELICLNHQFY